MIDLSFLTEEEQETILAVLKRDAELKKAEEQRIQKLQQIILDKGQLKYLTGEWFYETKQLRHQERIHGSDIIWASMKHTHKPMTILELSQIVTERPSFVSSENKEVFVPAVLSGLLQEPLTAPCSNWENVQTLCEQGTSKPLSPTKRVNPFNIGQDEPVCTEGKDQSSQTTPRSSFIQTIEYILPTDLINPYGPLQNLDQIKPVFLVSQKSVLKSVLEENTASLTNDYANAEVDVIPRGILKQLSDSAVLDPQTLDFRAESPPDPWADRKQVRFSSALSGSSAKRQDGKEIGEHSLLDVDTFTPTEEGRSDGKDSTSTADGPNQSDIKSTEVALQEGCQQGVSNDQPETCQTQSPVSPLISATLESAKQRLLGFFKRDKAKTTEAKMQKEVHSEKGDKSVKQELYDETTTSGGSLPQTTDDKQVDCPESASDLNASLVKDNSAIEVHKDPAETNIESTQNIQARLHIESNMSVCQNAENIAKTDSQGKQLLECSNEDGTYRAFPVLIYEDNEDSIICSVPETQICEPKPKPSPVVLPRQLSYIPQEDKPANVGELKNFWEECSGGRTSAPCSPVHSSKAPAASPMKTSGSQTKKDPIQMSPSKTITIKSVMVNDKGFVSQYVERSPSKSASLNALKRMQEIPHSPGTSPTKRPKDDDLRRSPSKTCHPRVLPRESASPEGSRPASPLKTFPIDIDTEEQTIKATPVQRLKKSPSHEAKSNSEDSEAKRGSPLARSIVPQDYEHYLGPHEHAHHPPFQNIDTEDNGALNRAQSPLRDFVGNLGGNKDHRVSSWIEQIKDSSDDTATRAWSLSRASAGSHDEKSGPVMSPLKRLSSKMSSSKSLENLTSPTREEKEQLNRSVDDVSEMPSTTSFATSKKSSASVPAFQLDETDSDSPFENNLSWRRNTGSSTSNISLSSGMASMSSVSGSMTSIYHADLGDVDVQGTIQFAVNYIQKLGEFHIFVVLCRDLAMGILKRAVLIHNFFSSYINPLSYSLNGQQRTNESCAAIPASDIPNTVLPDTSRKSRQKTRVVKRTANPMFNHTMVYDGFRPEDLREACVELTVWDHDRLNNHYIGGVRLAWGQGRAME
ncbi:hypothetical protein WMY93_016910 [Mugilogobius chulae]|uniref:Synaptotagmin-like protein 2 n=1 Tax=Mugilogobius chulae TaxID=88201 RepID=A0AAW0NMV3_9GOBI